MREIRTSGSTRGQQVTFNLPAVLLYWPKIGLRDFFQCPVRDWRAQFML
jgi:hypothetical protein